MNEHIEAIYQEAINISFGNKQKFDCREDFARLIIEECARIATASGCEPGKHSKAQQEARVIKHKILRLGL